MATITKPGEQENKAKRIPYLQTGDRLTRAEFERRYTAMPPNTRAELIEGTVYLWSLGKGVGSMPSPVSREHARAHYNLIGWLSQYTFATPGVEGGDNGTLRLDMDNEPQPDAYVFILKECGGRVQVDDDGFVSGSPELIGEVSISSVSIDLNAKFDVYRRNGVREYIVWRVEDEEIDWFILRGGQYERLILNAAGHYQSEALPGLWLDPTALVRSELEIVAQVAQQGRETPEHAAFVASLKQNRKP